MLDTHGDTKGILSDFSHKDLIAEHVKSPSYFWNSFLSKRKLRLTLSQLCIDYLSEEEYLLLQVGHG